jgi:hypothetical protein
MNQFADARAGKQEAIWTDEKEKRRAKIGAVSKEIPGIYQR